MYEGLPIATNKLSVEERKSIPHHLLDCIKLEAEPWTVTRFRSQAMGIIQEIRSRGRLPILVGGTHYYTQSIMFKDSLLNEGSLYVPAVELEQRWPILAASSEEMLEELRRVDPVMAATWHPKETRKIRRSLEIWLTSGKRPSDVYEKKKRQAAATTLSDELNAATNDGETAARSQHVATGTTTSLQYDPLILWTHASTSILRSRLDRRVETMLERGLLSEVQFMHQCLHSQVSASLIDQSRGILVAIGYKEFVPYLLALQDGKAKQKELEKLKSDAIEKTQIRTRQYAKSQIRWIRTKMISAISYEGIDKGLFILDGSDISKLAADVEAPAYDITAAFLQGRALPDPLTLCPAMADMLSPAGKQERQLRHCDVCDRTMMTNDAWQDHINSVKHKKTIKAKEG